MQDYLSSDDPVEPVEITLKTNTLDGAVLVNAIKSYAKDKLGEEFKQRYNNVKVLTIARELAERNPDVARIRRSLLESLDLKLDLGDIKIGSILKVLNFGRGGRVRLSSGGDIKIGSILKVLNVDELRDLFFSEKAILRLIETYNEDQEKWCVNAFSEWLEIIGHPLVIFIIYSTARQVSVDGSISQVLNQLNELSVRYVFELRGCEPLYNGLQSIEVSSLSPREAGACIEGKGANRFQNGIRSPSFMPPRPQRKRQSVVERVLEQTGTSPFLIQAVCFEWDKTRRKDLNRCLPTIKDNLKKPFNEWWQSLPQNVRNELSLLVSDEFRLSQLQRTNPTTFKQLKQYGLVVNLNRKLLIPRLVKDWLERNDQGDRKMNIFISHSHRDSAFATQLASDLRNAGLDIFIDEWSLKPGDSIVQKINQAIRDSDYLIVILSPDSVQSPWVQAEINAALMRQLGKRNISIIPVLYRQCSIPPLLAPYVYVNFTTSSYEDGLIKLLEVFRRDASRQVLLPPSPPSPPAPSPCSRLDRMIRDDLIKELSDCLMMEEWMRLCLHLTDKLPEEVGANKVAQITTVVSQVYRHNRKQDLLDWIYRNRPDLCE